MEHVQSPFLWLHPRSPPQWTRSIAWPKSSEAWTAVPTLAALHSNLPSRLHWSLTKDLHVLPHWVGGVWPQICMVSICFHGAVCFESGRAVTDPSSHAETQCFPFISIKKTLHVIWKEWLPYCLFLGIHLNRIIFTDMMAEVRNNFCKQKGITAQHFSQLFRNFVEPSVQLGILLAGIRLNLLPKNQGS